LRTLLESIYNRTDTLWIEIFKLGYILNCFELLFVEFLIYTGWISFALLVFNVYVIA